MVQRFPFRLSPRTFIPPAPSCEGSNARNPSASLCVAAFPAPTRKRDVGDGVASSPARGLVTFVRSLDSSSRYCASQSEGNDIANVRWHILPVQHQPFIFICCLLFGVINVRVPSTANTIALNVVSIEEYPIGLFINHQKQGGAHFPPRIISTGQLRRSAKVMLNLRGERPAWEYR